MAGRAFPVKFRIRRNLHSCNICGKKSYLRDPITDNTNIVLISNCCDVEVYQRSYIDNWHRVPVLSITGNKSMKKKTIKDIVVVKAAKIAPPPPPPPAPLPEPKKPAAKGKGKKGKKK